MPSSLRASGCPPKGTQACDLVTGAAGLYQACVCVCELRVLCELSLDTVAQSLPSVAREVNVGTASRACNSRGSQKPSLSEMKSLPTGHCLKFHHPSFIFSTQ